MYVRPPSYRYQAPMRVPENYSGNVFNQKGAEEVKEAIDRTVPTPEKLTEPTESVTEQVTPALLGGNGFRLRLPSLFGKDNGIGSEELLILALILLLSDAGGSESFDDLILFLVLLFFIR